MAIKRLSLQRSSRVKLNLTAPSEPRLRPRMFYFVCDSYFGCDQEYKFSLDVGETMDVNDANNDDGGWEDGLGCRSR
ncbi:hypothetical protein CDL15_Pgr021557 [Punica granatum]|uniref:Uncharacterized protein n=1 Tax=Punica granatum TaxID=22663 RepID=A0A218WRY1_PUNGR|nr:hypothetical protein CDL15_Pgr021557 [Punica granatum]PKI62223.1 hypothetical protein CRG98_017357 [Punica granatum]